MPRYVTGVNKLSTDSYPGICVQNSVFFRLREAGLFIEAAGAHGVGLTLNLSSYLTGGPDLFSVHTTGVSGQYDPDSAVASSLVLTSWGDLGGSTFVQLPPRINYDSGRIGMGFHYIFDAAPLINIGIKLFTQFVTETADVFYVWDE